MDILAKKLEQVLNNPLCLYGDGGHPNIFLLVNDSIIFMIAFFSDLDDFKHFKFKHSGDHPNFNDCFVENNQKIMVSSFMLTNDFMILNKILQVLRIMKSEMLLSFLIKMSKIMCWN